MHTRAGATSGPSVIKNCRHTVSGPNGASDPRPPEEREVETMGKCAQLCLSLASGRYDGLSGQFLTPDDDLDALLALAK